MATSIRLSTLFGGVLLTTLLLSLSFLPCNATSRNMKHTDLGEGAALPSGSAATHSSANSRAGRESWQTRSAVSEQDLHTMHPAELTPSLSSMDSTAVVAKISDQRMSDHDEDSERVSDFEHKTLMDMEQLRDSNTLREDQTSMRASAYRYLSENLEKMRDPRTDRMSGSERTSDSADTMSDIDKRIRNPQRLRDSQQTREESQRVVSSTDKMRDSEFTKDSDGSREWERPRDSDRMRDSLDRSTMDSGKMRDSGRMMNRDGVRDSHGMIKSDRMRGSDRSMMDAAKLRDSERMMNWDGMRDSHGIIESDRMRDSSHTMINSDGMRDTHRMRDSDSMRYSHEVADSDMMMDSDALRDFQRMSTSHVMSPMDHETSRNSEEMLTLERTNSPGDSEKMRDSIQMVDQEKLRESSENLRNSERSADFGNTQDEQSELMRDTHRTRTSERRRDLEKTREAYNVMDSAAAQRHSSTAEPSSCQGARCHSTSDLHRTDSRAMDHEAMPLSFRRSDAEITGSQSDDAEDSIDSSTAAERGSGMNVADRETALHEHLPGSRNMQISKRDDLSSSCRLEGADCRKAATREANNDARSMETKRSTIPERTSSYSKDECRSTTANNEEPMEVRERRMRNNREKAVSPKWMKLERTTSTINEAKRMDNSQKTSPMANQGMAISTEAKIAQTSRESRFGSIDVGRKHSNLRGSEMQHSTSNHWTRSTAEITGARLCTNEDDCRRTSRIMHMSQRDFEILGPRHDEITGARPCTNEADCKSTSRIMHMSSRASKLQGHTDEDMNGRSSCTNEADCRSTSEIMLMSTSDSPTTGLKYKSEMTHTGSNLILENGDPTMDQEMVDDSKMMHKKSNQMNASAEKIMHNSDEATADNLPVHRGN